MARFYMQYMVHRNKLNLNIENLKQDEIELRLYLNSRTLSWHALEKLGLISSIIHTHTHKWEGGPEGRGVRQDDTCHPKAEKEREAGPGAHWPGSLLKLVSFRFSERPCFLVIR